MQNHADVEAGKATKQVASSKTFVKHNHDGTTTSVKTTTYTDGSEETVEEMTEAYSDVQAPVATATPTSYQISPLPHAKKNRKGLVIATSVNGFLAVLFWILLFLLYGWLWLVLALICTIAAAVCGIVLCTGSCSN